MPALKTKFKRVNKLAFLTCCDLEWIFLLWVTMKKVDVELLFPVVEPWNLSYIVMFLAITICILLAAISIIENKMHQNWAILSHLLVSYCYNYRFIKMIRILQRDFWKCINFFFQNFKKYEESYKNCGNDRGIRK